MHEAAATIGGGVRSEELTLPGFTHDVCSAIHPLGRDSPFFRDLELPVDWVQPPAPAAHPLDDGTAAITERSLLATAEGLGEDRAAYLRLLDRVVSRWSDFEPVVLGPFLPRPNRLLHAVDLSVTRDGLSSAPLLAKRCPRPTGRARSWPATRRTRCCPLETRPSGGIGLFLIATAHVYGWGFPRGGSQRLADALAERLEELGGEIRTESRVDELPRARCRAGGRRAARASSHRGRPAARSLRARAAPLPPRAWGLQARLGARRPDPLDARRLRPRRDGPPRWHPRGDRRVGALRPGGPPCRAPVRPPDAADRSSTTRARPPGKHTAWAYCHVPNGSTEDMTDRIEAQVERFAPGFRDLDPRPPCDWAGRLRDAATETSSAATSTAATMDLAPAPLPPGAEARSLSHAAERPLPLLVLDTAGRRRPRHVRLFGRAHCAERWLGSVA